MKASWYHRWHFEGLDLPKALELPLSRMSGRPGLHHGSRIACASLIPLHAGAVLL